MGKEGDIVRLRRLLQYWLPVFMWMAFIFWMSTGTFSSENTASVIGPLLLFLFPQISPQTVDMIHLVIRKFGHVSEYFILGLLLFRAFREDSADSRTHRWAFAAFVVLLLYAASDEYHQSFIAVRSASLSDIAIDAMGGVLSQGVVALSQIRRKRHAASGKIS